MKLKGPYRSINKRRVKEFKGDSLFLGSLKGVDGGLKEWKSV